MKIHIKFLLFISVTFVCIQTINAQKQSIVQFIQDRELLSKNNLQSDNPGLLCIFRWSKDGKVLYSINPNYGQPISIFIVDLITDEVLFQGEDWDADRAIELSDEYEIEPVSGKTGLFPYIDSNETLTAETINTLADGGRYEYNLQVIKSGGNKPGKKIIGTFERYAGIYFDEKPEVLYVKSPFENRLLVVLAIPVMHIEFDYMLYDFRIFGCDLSKGFK